MLIVNAEIFVRVYFRETQMRSFLKIKPARNDEIILSFTDAGKSDPSREMLKSQICILALFAVKLLAKISGFTVCKKYGIAHFVFKWFTGRNFEIMIYFCHEDFNWILDKQYRPR